MRTAGDRIRHAKPHEYLIFFTLLVLLALCLTVSQVVIVDDGAGPSYGRTAKT